MSADFETELYAYISAEPDQRGERMVGLALYGAAILPPLNWIHMDLQDESRLALEELAFEAIAFEALRGGPWDREHDRLLVRVHERNPKAMRAILYAMGHARAVALIEQILVRHPTAAALLVDHVEEHLVELCLSAFELNPRAAWLELPADAVKAFGNSYAPHFVRILEAATRLDAELARVLKLRFKKVLSRSGRPSRAITVEPAPS